MALLQAPFPFLSSPSPSSFSSPLKKPFILCSSTTQSPPQNPNPQPARSLSDQLKPLSLTLLKTQTQQQPETKPKSIWVNPCKPKPAVLSLSRHPKSPPPRLTKEDEQSDLNSLTQSLSDLPIDSLNSAFTAAFPTPPSPSVALHLLSSLRPAASSLLLLRFLKSAHPSSLPSPSTLPHNLVLRNLSRGPRPDPDLSDSLALEMLRDSVPLDNVTYSTLISSLNRSRRPQRALHWFNHMYKSNIVPDEITYSAAIHVYVSLKRNQDAISLYERARGSGWVPDVVTFAVLAKMYGDAGDYDGLSYIWSEMRKLSVRANVVVYNALITGMGRAGRPGEARRLFEEMMEEGLRPNEKTLTAMVKIYGKARWSKDAMELWTRMREEKWPADFVLYNALLSMFADLGLEKDAEQLFDEMKKRSGGRGPDSWSYAAMVKVYASGGRPKRAMEVFDEMLASGVRVNVMSCTCLIQCLAKAGKVGDAVRVFETSLARGVVPDDQLCGCLLSVVALCEEDEIESVLSCLRRANPRLVTLIEMLSRKEARLDELNEELRVILNEASVEVRRPFCNCLIDICINGRFPHQRAQEIFRLGNLYGVYSGLQAKSSDAWALNLKSLSVGAASTAFDDWVENLSENFENEELVLPGKFCVHTGAGSHRFSQGLPVAFDSYLKKLGAPFRRDESRNGSFVALRDELISWLQSRV